jgi:RNA polymerase sigma-70 factor (ECF subfamily)
MAAQQAAEPLAPAWRADRPRRQLRQLDPEAADRAAVRRVRDGDAQAVAELYDRHAQAASTLARQLLRTDAAADDVVQEAFVSLWRHAGRYDPERGSVRTWLLGIVRYRALDVHRRDASQQRTLARELADAAVRAERPEVLLQRQDRARDMRRAVAALPQPQAEAIALAFYGGMTQVEIADALSVPLGTIKSRVRLGLRKLAAGMAHQRLS